MQIWKNLNRYSSDFDTGNFGEIYKLLDKIHTSHQNFAILTLAIAFEYKT